MISPYSLDQFLISNTPRTRKGVKKVKKSKDVTTLRGEEKSRFIVSVGSRSDDRDKLRSPPITINHDHYNSLNGPSRLNVI